MFVIGLRFISMVWCSVEERIIRQRPELLNSISCVQHPGHKRRIDIQSILSFMLLINICNESIVEITFSLCIFICTTETSDYNRWPSDIIQ